MTRSDDARGRSWAARVSLAASAPAAVGVVLYLLSNPIASLAALVCLALSLLSGWYAAGGRRHRWLLLTAAVVLLGLSLALLLETRRDRVIAVAVLALAVISLVAGRIALRHGVTEARDRVAVPVGRAGTPSSS
jgi:hypothetical protein